jgi:YVTN family beta-propeller protein
MIFLAAALAACLSGCHEMPGAEAAQGTSIARRASSPAATSYTIRKVPLPGEGRGDYLLADADARRLYVTHSGALHILDLDTLKPVTAIVGFKAAHGVALDKAGGHGFVTDGERNVIVMFDLATDKVTGTIATGGTKPDSIVLDPASGNLFVVNNGSSTISVIDPATGAVRKTLKTPEGPESVRADGKGKLWVNIDSANAIAEIDTRSMTIARQFKLRGCEGPAPLALDEADRILFSGCGNGVLSIVDAESGRTLDSLKVGSDPDGIAFDRDRKKLFVANRDGGWTILTQHARDRYSVEQILKIDPYAKTIALDPRTHRLFSSTADLIWPRPTPGKKLLPNARSGSFRLLVVSEK